MEQLSKFIRPVILISLSLLFAISNTFAQADETISGVRDNVGDAIGHATDIVSIDKILTILVVIGLVWFLVKATGWAFEYAVKRFPRSRLRILRIQPVVNVFMWILAIFVLIKTLFDPSAETIYALGASSALALGFAAQDILKNIFGGLLIIVDRPFQVGDRINVNGNYGEVVNIGIRTTQVNTLDDNLVTIPNSMIVSDNVANANAGALDCMVVINMWLPININVEKVREIANEAVLTSCYLNLEKNVSILFFDHFDKEPATNLKIKAYVFDARYEKAFEGDVTEAAKRAFIEAGIYK